MAPLFPTVKWAQRSDSILLTLALADVEEKTAQISLTSKSLKFVGKSGGKDYEVELVFFKEIDDAAEETKYQIRPREVSFYLKKKVNEDDDEEETTWSRLLENKKIQKAHVKIDFDKWVDSDDEGADEQFAGLDGMQGMPPGMGGMGGGMPGMGGMGGMPGGMDLQSMMAGMGGAGGAGGAGGGAGGFDMEALMKQMQESGELGGEGEGDDEGEEGEDDDDLPELDE